MLKIDLTPQDDGTMGDCPNCRPPVASGPSERLAAADAIYYSASNRHPFMPADENDNASPCKCGQRLGADIHNPYPLVASEGDAASTDTSLSVSIRDGGRGGGGESYVGTPTNSHKPAAAFSTPVTTRPGTPCATVEELAERAREAWQKFHNKDNYTEWSTCDEDTKEGWRVAARAVGARMVKTCEWQAIVGGQTVATCDLPAALCEIHGGHDGCAVEIMQLQAKVEAWGRESGLPVEELARELNVLPVLAGLRAIDRWPAALACARVALSRPSPPTFGEGAIVASGQITAIEWEGEGTVKVTAIVGDDTRLMFRDRLVIVRPPLQAAVDAEISNGK